MLTAELSGKGHTLHHHHHSFEGSPPLWAALLLFFVAWQAMVAAMMLPTSLRSIRLFEAASSTHEHAWRAQVAFLAGYTAVWTGFGALALLGDLGVRRPIDAVPWLAERPSLITGSIFVLAGGFQFSKLKQHCLTRCCHPAPYILAHYRRGAAAGFRVGCGHGVFCLGCCWALMLLMFAPGVATPWWMAALTLLMVYEKVGRHASAAARVAGTALLGAAVLQFAVLRGPTSSATGTTLGPGPVRQILHAGVYRLELRMTPNRAATAGTIVLGLRSRAHAVNGARIETHFTMLDMNMGEISTRLRQTGPGTYAAPTPPLPMSGRWNLRLQIGPIRGDRLTLDIIDQLAP
jgi:predicted metal-binding membrane protein